MFNIRRFLFFSDGYIYQYMYMLPYTTVAVPSRRQKPHTELPRQKQKWRHAPYLSGGMTVSSYMYNFFVSKLSLLQLQNNKTICHQ